MRLEILNNFSGDDKHDIDTSTYEGRAQASKIVGELIKSGSAVFLEREVNGQTYTYRVTNYDAEKNKLTIRLDAPVEDAAIEVAPEPRKRRGRPAGIPRGASYGRIAPEAGRAVAVAPRSGG